MSITIKEIAFAKVQMVRENAASGELENWTWREFKEAAGDLSRGLAMVSSDLKDEHLVDLNLCVERKGMTWKEAYHSLAKITLEHFTTVYPELAESDAEDPQEAAEEPWFRVGNIEVAPVSMWKHMAWEDGKDYCKSLDCFMPNGLQLNSLLKDDEIGLVDGFCWSSSECGYADAWVERQSDGAQGESCKGDAFWVIPCRKVASTTSKEQLVKKAEQIGLEISIDETGINIDFPPLSESPSFGASLYINKPDKLSIEELCKEVLDDEIVTLEKETLIPCYTRECLELSGMEPLVISRKDVACIEDKARGVVVVYAVNKDTGVIDYDNYHIVDSEKWAVQVKSYEPWHRIGDLEVAPVSLWKELPWDEGKEYCESLCGFMPDKEQLAELLKNDNVRAVIDGRCLMNDWFWTSSEYSSLDAWIQRPSDGDQLNYGKDVAHWVVPCRKIKHEDK